MNIYGKKEAQMTRGMAILWMVLLHLYCRSGDTVVGKPLIWLNETDPLMLWFGFFGEICVPLYSMCAGYALWLNSQKGTTLSNWKNNLRRVWRLLVNYWIILVIFAVLGIFFDTTGKVPGDVATFVKCFFLASIQYNGAWWFLHTYIILMLIPSFIVLFPVKRMKCSVGLAVCLVLQIGWYLLQRFGVTGIVFDYLEGYTVFRTVWNEIYNLITVLPYFWAGAFLCKGDLINKINAIFVKHIGQKWRKPLLCVSFVMMFVVTNLLSKSVTIPIVALITLILFNLWSKGKTMQAVFGFLGKHSTNIWLTHMFFYARPFENFVYIVQYPILVILFMLLLCVTTSYIVMGIQKLIFMLGGKIQGLRKKPECSA